MLNRPAPSPLGKSGEKADCGPLRVRLLTEPEQLQALAAECDALARAMQPRLPFRTSRWLTLWWEHYRENRLAVRDRFYVHELRDAAGKLVALAPLMLTERPGSGPLRSRGVSFFGGDKNVTELRGLVCAPEHEAAAVTALLEHMTSHQDDWDWFAWDGISRDSEAYEILSRTPGFEWTRQCTDYVLRTPESWDEFRSSRTRNIKESLRKCYNSLKRDGHHFEFRVVSEAAELPGAIERFFELHSRRSGASNLVKHEDVFAIPQARKLLLQLASMPDGEPSLRVFQLLIAGEVVATRLAFVLGDELYLYFSGYDPAWAAYSVMTTTVAESLKWAIDNRFKLVNLSPGTDVSKTRWGAESVTTCSGVLRSHTPRGRLMLALLTELDERSRKGTLLGKLIGYARRHG